MTNLRLGGDFLEFDLSGLVGLPFSDLLGAWKWPILVLINVPLLVWLAKSVRPVRITAGSELTKPSAEPAKARIFLSYSWDDRERVMQIHDLLKAAGAQPWIDRNEIRGGAEWELSIRQQMRNSERVIIFLSCSSIQKAGYAWAEIRMAARIAEEWPEGRPFIIPVKIDDCRLPDVLSRWDCVELFQAGGEAKLMEALGLHPAAQGAVTANDRD